MEPGIPAGSATIITPQVRFGEQPVQVICGNCRQTVVTTTTLENGSCAYVATLVVFFLCCPCFWVPLVIDNCKDVTHTCPSCGTLLGQYKRM